MNDVALVDSFVAAVNSMDRLPLEAQEAPPSVRVGEHDEYDWQIKRHSGIDWVEPLEQRLPFGFPEPYRSLVTRYIFPHFVIGGIELLGNTPEGTDWRELRVRLFEDATLSRVLLGGGYLQFGFGEDGSSYDPICFDMNRGPGNEDRPIVRLNHEAVLCDDAIQVVAEIAASFGELIAEVVGGSIRQQRRGPSR